MPNASMMCDVGNHEENSTTNNEAISTHIANNIEIKTKHQKNVNCKIKRMMKLNLLSHFSLCNNYSKKLTNCYNFDPINNCSVDFFCYGT